MAVNVQKAASFTDRFLTKTDRGREWVRRWWLDWTPEGIAIKNNGGLGADPTSISDSAFFIETVVLDIQKWVFGEIVDLASKEPRGEPLPSEADGYLGTATDRRMETFVDYMGGSTEDYPSLSNQVAEEADPESGYILFDGKKIVVPNTRIITMDMEDSLDFVRDSGRGYYKWPDSIEDLIAAGDKRYAYLLATIHWDATLSAKTCFRILKKRGLSSCFGVDSDPDLDGDVTVYQWLDPGKYRGAHGGTKANRASVLSFDLSNAVYTKYASRYKKQNQFPRPVIKPMIHGRRSKGMLGMYKGQILATLRIMKAVGGHLGLPLVFPTDDKQKPVTTVYGDLFGGGFHGAHTHMHITRKKWDVAGFEDQVIILLLTDPKLAEEFPSIMECFNLTDPAWQGWLEDHKSSWKWAEIGW
jgi:hypothetical protein